MSGRILRIFPNLEEYRFSALLRRLARWILAQATEPTPPEPEPAHPRAVPLPEDWPKVWPERANRHYWARGWGHYQSKCPACGLEYASVAAVGTVCAARCPRCGARWEEVWPGMEGEGECGNDGVWL